MEPECPGQLVLCWAGSLFPAKRELKREPRKTWQGLSGKPDICHRSGFMSGLNGVRARGHSVGCRAQTVAKIGSLFVPDLILDRAFLTPFSPFYEVSSSVMFEIEEISNGGGPGPVSAARLQREPRFARAERRPGCPI